MEGQRQQRPEDEPRTDDFELHIHDDGVDDPVVEGVKTVPPRRLLLEDDQRTEEVKLDLEKPSLVRDSVVASVILVLLVVLGATFGAGIAIGYTSRWLF